MVPKKEGTMKLIKIPKILADYWYSVNDCFCYGYYHIFCWILVAHCVNPGKCTLTSLCHWIPEKILYKYLVRLLQSDRWNFQRVFHWHCRQVWGIIPPPEDRILYLVVDKTLVDKTGKKHPYNKKTKISQTSEWRFGFYVVILMAQWGPYRFPIDFRLVRPKEDAKHQTPNELFREMFDQFAPPRWAKQVIVLGDCEYAAKENLKAIIQRNNNAHVTGVEYWFNLSFPRTWKLDGELTAGGKPKNLKDLVNHLPRCRYKKMWFTDIDGHRRTYWVYTRKARLDSVGDVTIVISKKRRNTPPHKAKIFVTNIPSASARIVAMNYRRRWYIEVLNHELKSACGLGDHQVTKKAERVQRSVALSMICYLTILRFEADKIKPKEHWSINTLKYFFAIQIFQAQSEPCMLAKTRKEVA